MNSIKKESMNRLSVSVAMLKNADHFLMKCHNNQAQRVKLIPALSQHTSVTLHTLLFGNDSLPININIEFFEAMQTYVVNTKRF